MIEGTKNRELMTVNKMNETKITSEKITLNEKTADSVCR
jgi:hypothetical protein